MTGMRNRRRGLGVVAGFALVVAGLVAAALPGTAVGAGRGATTVRGVQLAAGTCPDGGYRMTGSLDGCWWIETFESATSADHSNFRATGTERFEGWLGDVYGIFHTTYQFTAKMDGPWAVSAEIHGRCHHPVTWGEGGFAGISGEISFHDVVVDPPYYPYWGNLRLPGSDAHRAGSTVRSASIGVGSTLGGRLPRTTSSSTTSAVMPC